MNDSIVGGKAGILGRWNRILIPLYARDRNVFRF